MIPAAVVKLCDPVVGIAELRLREPCAADFMIIGRVLSVAIIFGGLAGWIGDPVWGALVCATVSGLTLAAGDLAAWWSAQRQDRVGRP